MSQTVKSKLRDLMKQQESELKADDRMQVDGTDDAVSAMMKGTHGRSPARDATHEFPHRRSSNRPRSPPSSMP